MLLTRTMELAPLPCQIHRMAHDSDNSLMQLRNNLRRPSLLALHKPILPASLFPFTIHPNRIQAKRPGTNNIKRIPANQPNVLQALRILGIKAHLLRQMTVHLKRRLELLDLLHSDNVLEDIRMVFQIWGLGDAVGDHCRCAVGEDDGVDVGRRAQFLARSGDVWEDAEGVVGFEHVLQVFFREREGAFGEGVFEGLDCYVGKVFVLAWQER